LDKIEKQNINLRDIAWLQSHIVRTPLSKILGLLSLISNGFVESENEKIELINDTLTAANELDKIIKDVVSKTNELDKT